jgi:Uma2 family endonuclease
MSTKIRTIADLLRRLGDVPPDRIRFHPAPGTATLADVDRIHEEEGVLCELVEGVLLEKIVGYSESQLAGIVLRLLGSFVNAGNRGIVTGADGTMEIMPDLVRFPDVAFTSWDRIPGRRRPKKPIPRLVPNLAVEVLSENNTVAEMATKRQDYFAAGVNLVWEIDPEQEIATVFTSPTDAVTLGVADFLDGGAVLPGFLLSLADLFAEFNRHG